MDSECNYCGSRYETRKCPTCKEPTCEDCLKVCEWTDCKTQFYCKGCKVYCPEDSGGCGNHGLSMCKPCLKDMEENHASDWEDYHCSYCCEDTHICDECNERRGPDVGGKWFKNADIWICNFCI